MDAIALTLQHLNNDQNYDEYQLNDQLIETNNDLASMTFHRIAQTTRPESTTSSNNYYNTHADKERARLILTTLYLFMLSTCIIIPCIFYVRTVFLDREEDRHMENNNGDDDDDEESLNGEESMMSEERLAARRKRRVEKKTRLLACLTGFQMEVAAEHIVDKHIHDGCKDIESLSDCDKTENEGWNPEEEEDINDESTHNTDHSSINNERDEENALTQNDDEKEEIDTPLEKDLVKREDEDDDDENNESFLILPPLQLSPSPISPSPQTTDECITKHEKEEQNDDAKQQQQEQEKKQIKRQKSERIVTNTCAICLGPYHAGNVVVWSSNTDCTHVFHKECILKWLMKLPAEQSICPCCRREFIIDDTNDDDDDDGNVDVEAGQEEEEGATRR